MSRRLTTAQVCPRFNLLLICDLWLNCKTLDLIRSSFVILRVVYFQSILDAWHLIGSDTLMIRRAHAQHVERSLTNRFSFAGVRQLVVNTFCGRFKFAFRSLCQASMITFVGYFSECLYVFEIYHIFAIR